MKHYVLIIFCIFMISCTGNKSYFYKKSPCPNLNYQYKKTPKKKKEEIKKDNTEENKKEEKIILNPKFR